MHRRIFLTHLSALLALGSGRLLAETSQLKLQVWKSPTCTCCGKWVAHMQAAGFEVSATNVANVNVYKEQHGLPMQLASCHTGIVGGYVVEGHVPAEDVIRMLAEKPAIKGLAVPGMPLGSPGMEAPNAQYYETVAFDAEGHVSVWAKHGPGA
jgi:hypothetical protein